MRGIFPAHRHFKYESFAQTRQLQACLLQYLPDTECWWILYH